jgi:hypothetical protein
VPDLWPGTVSGAWHRRGWNRGHSDDRAHGRCTGYLSRFRAVGRAFRLGTSAGAPVRRGPAGRRGRLGHNLADHTDRGAGDGAGRRECRAGGCRWVRHGEPP